MTRKPKGFTYRVDEIPPHYTSEDQLLQAFHSDDKRHISVGSFVSALSATERGEHTATIEWRGEGAPHLDNTSVGIELDGDFHGFTPLNEAVEQPAAE